MTRRHVRAATWMPIAILTLELALTACSEKPGDGWDWNRMRQQPRYVAYDSNLFFGDGSAMRVPPAGTIDRETIADSSARSATADLARGATRFHIFCAVCHGERGDGASIVAQNMDDPKPPSLLVAPVRGLTSERMFEVITNGAGHMPSFGAQLSAVDRWQVVAYVADLQRRSLAPRSDSLAAPADTQR